MNARVLCRRLGAGFVVACLVGSAAAQWSNDPAQNLALTAVAGGQNQAKVAPTPDGGCYISWYDNRASGYAIYLQRLDALGNPLWSANGVVVAATTLGSTTDYGLALDAQGNALLTYQDNRPGTTQIGANKVAPDGSLLWGPLGLVLTNTTDFVATPKVTVTSDGFYVIGWFQGNDFQLQKFDSNGVAQWNPPVHEIRPGTTGAYFFDTLRGADSGTVIASWVYRIGGISSNKYIYAQKYDANGNRLWNGGNAVIVYDGGSIQNGYFPSFALDGQGGAVFGWYEVTTRKAWVQHVDSNGTQLFPHNGVAASTSALLHLQPAYAYDAGTGDIYLFWTMTNSNQSQYGLYAQRFNAAGARQWGDGAVVLVPLGDNQTANVQSVCVGHSAEVFYSDRSGSALLKGFRLAANGSQLWSSPPRTVCSTLSSKARLTVDTTPSGMAILAWSDGRIDGGDIYVQNVNPDGGLGLPAFILGDMNCDGAINFGDINPFVLALTGPDAYAAAFPDCDWLHADVNGDGTVNFGDINPFVALLTGN